jgi:hypothetical protein
MDAGDRAGQQGEQYGRNSESRKDTADVQDAETALHSVKEGSQIGAGAVSGRNSDGKNTTRP